MEIHTRALLASLAAFVLFSPSTLAAEPGCKYLEAARLPLRYAGVGLDITTDGSINGKPATMLVDTGSFQTFLTRTASDRHKLVLRNTGYEASGIGGQAAIYQTRVDEFSVGPARSGRMSLRVLKDFGKTPHYDALVGAPFLLQTDLEISLATKEMRFFRPQGCADSFLGYWDQNAIVIPFTRGLRARDNPHFTVVVNGEKMVAMIDSGAHASFISLHAAKRAGLKLDAPDVTRMADSSGVGTRKVARWRTTFKRFEIGEEVVHNAEVGVLDYRGEVDVLLGADFLRAHRVLFAMSQGKIYLSYVGGEPFGQRHRLEPWIQAEADAGNADAQMTLATYYLEGKLVPRNPMLAAQWVEKAASGGNAEANIATGHLLLATGRYAEAAARLRAGLDRSDAYPEAALGLYLARLRTGQPELAKTELAALRERNREDDWPAPIADFYLGKIGEAKLLDEAQDERKLAVARTCQALRAMSEWYAASGQPGEAARLTAQGKERCATPAAPAPAAM